MHDPLLVVEYRDGVLVDGMCDSLERFVHIVDFFFEAADASSEMPNGIFDIVETPINNHEMFLDTIESPIDTTETGLHYLNHILQCRLSLVHTLEYIRAASTAVKRKTPR